MSDRGAIYCVTGQQIYLESALISALAFRQLNPATPVTIVCDLPIDESALQDYGITVIGISETTHQWASRYLKTQLASLTPYTETLYLDADILPLQPFSAIWDEIEHHDLALVVDRRSTIGECDHIAEIERDYTLARLPNTTTQYNGGAILWRNTPEVMRFFAAWTNEWQRFGQHDQLALVRALSIVSISVASLPPRYNISPCEARRQAMPENVVCGLHFWARQVASGEYRRVAQHCYPQIVSIAQAFCLKA
jgi:hypothetical protein